MQRGLIVREICGDLRFAADAHDPGLTNLVYPTAGTPLRIPQEVPVGIYRKVAVGRSGVVGRKVRAFLVLDFIDLGKELVARYPALTLLSLGVRTGGRAAVAEVLEHFTARDLLESTAPDLLVAAVLLKAIPLWALVLILFSVAAAVNGDLFPSAVPALAVELSLCAAALCGA